MEWNIKYLTQPYIFVSSLSPPESERSHKRLLRVFEWNAGRVPDTRFADGFSFFVCNAVCRVVVIRTYCDRNVYTSGRETKAEIHFGFQTFFYIIIFYFFYNNRSVISNCSRVFRWSAPVPGGGGTPIHATPDRVNNRQREPMSKNPTVAPNSTVFRAPHLWLLP